MRDVVPKDPYYRLKLSDGTEPEALQYSIYNPLSVVKAVSTGVIQNYWNKTETYEALAEYIRMNWDGLKETVAVLMDGGRVGVNIRTYENDMTTFHGKDDVLTLLIHLGYLGYDLDAGEAFFKGNLGMQGRESSGAFGMVS